MTIYEHPDWAQRGACYGLAERIGQVARDRLFFPSRGEPIKATRKICAGCEVSEQCLEYALTESIRFGVWGGKSERERRTMRRQRAREQGIRLPGRQPIGEAT
jgi:WhiB family redox-sensing transcriptional regulator